MISKVKHDSAILSLPSHPKSLLSLESWVNSLCSSHNISVEIYGNILISLSEAVNNAISHGNHNIVSKKTIVNYSLKKKKIIFSVIDEGKGFNFLDVPDPTLPENLEKPHGRGIFLMKSLSDGLVYENPGNKVEITFDL